MVSVMGNFKFDFKENPEVEFENLDLDRSQGEDRGSFQDRIQRVRKELIKSKKIKPTEIIVDFADRNEELARKIVSLEEAAKANIEINQMKNKFYYDRDCHYQEIKPGSWVRIKQPNPSAFPSRYGKPERKFFEDGKGRQAVVLHNRLKMHHIDEKYLVPPIRN
ncbi:hypothetical protein RF11_14231 [Thelohanellus kitauei]|uniref:Uncharacterized protein n=1 Tax=Thelohanellus kitauei TaxID=669202 RepID=A0A0C2ILN4_THEKT|nr:hypothetical protein RF11_14231 [Thelohanellus kitauei]